MADPVTVARIALLLGDGQNRKRLGWVIAAILSPIILVVALLCVLGSGAASHNISAAQLCFQDGDIPAEVPAEYRVCIEQMRQNFSELDEIISTFQEDMDEGASLDPIRVKAVFYSLYFGGQAPTLSQFVSCFADSEIRTRRVDTTDLEGKDVKVDQTYTAYIPIQDMVKVYEKLSASLGIEITEGQKSNADSVYSLIKYG